MVRISKPERTSRKIISVYVHEWAPIKDIWRHTGSKFDIEGDFQQFKARNT